jgi:ABC-type amino acid transport substrate-binding protein
MADTVNMIVHDAPSVLILAAENQDRGMSPMPTLLSDEYLAWKSHRANSALLEQANQFIKEIKSDGRIEKMVSRWIPIEK